MKISDNVLRNLLNRLAMTQVAGRNTDAVTNAIIEHRTGGKVSLQGYKRK